MRRPTLRTALALAAVLAALALAAVYLTAGHADAEQATAGDAREAAAEGAGEASPPPIPVRVETLVRGPIASYLSATANLVAENEVEVIAEWEGRLTELHADEGDGVDAGEVLAVLAQTDALIARDKAAVRADDARHKHRRASRLAEQELISVEELDRARLALAIAEQELAEAEWRLEKTRIRAPFAGRVTARTAQLGQHVRPGDALFTVSDFDPLVARIYLPERDVLALRAGRSVRIASKADDGVRFAGRIRAISPVVDAATGTVKVTVEAIRPPAAIRPGGFVRVDVVRERRAGAVLVPRQAVVRELKRSYVFVADGGQAVRRDVELGLEEGGRFEAVAGLEAGERVIVAGQGSLEDGAAIEPIDDHDQPGAAAGAR